MMNSQMLDEMIDCPSADSQLERVVAVNVSRPAAGKKAAPLSTIAQGDLEWMMTLHGYPESVRNIVESERLLPLGLVNRLHALYPKHSRLQRTGKFLFQDRDHYTGLKGFRAVVATLKANGIDIGHIPARELFVEVYRFLATRHTLNCIDWDNYENDSIYQLVFPQPGMINDEEVL